MSCPWACCLGAGWKVFLHTRLIYCKCSDIYSMNADYGSRSLTLPLFHMINKSQLSTPHLYSLFYDTCAPVFEPIIGWVLFYVPFLPFSLKCAAQGKLTDRYSFCESSAWSEWECWPPPGPWSQLCLSLLNLPYSVPPSHCPFDDALGKAKRPGSSGHHSDKELERFLFFSLSKDEKAQALI